MEAQPYENLRDLELLELAIWREARGEQKDGMRGVGHVIANRVLHGERWYGSGDWYKVILHPFQFSSFNPDNPEANLWPADTDLSFIKCCQVAIPIFNRDDEDITLGATYYHDTSIGWPHSWGNRADYEQTLAVGDLLFFKPRPAETVMGVDDSTQV